MSLAKLTGRKVILPIWHGLRAEDVCRYSPMLADRIDLPSAVGIDALAEAILDEMRAPVSRAAATPRQVAATPTDATSTLTKEAKALLVAASRNRMRRVESGPANDR